MFRRAAPACTRAGRSGEAGPDARAAGDGEALPRRGPGVPGRVGRRGFAAQQQRSRSAAGAEDGAWVGWFGERRSRAQPGPWGGGRAGPDLGQIYSRLPRAAVPLQSRHPISRWRRAPARAIPATRSPLSSPTSTSRPRSGAPRHSWGACPLRSGHPMAPALAAEEAGCWGTVLEGSLACKWDGCVFLCSTSGFGRWRAGQPAHSCPCLVGSCRAPGHKPQVPGGPCSHW